MKRKARSKVMTFKSIEDADIENIHAHQNGDCRVELSEMLGFDETWAPMSVSQIKEKLDEKRKEARSAIFGLMSEAGEFVGITSFTSRWDPWCPRFEIIIWPESRRNGFGGKTARIMLDKTFDDHVANATSISIPEWSNVARKFAKSVGLKECGRMRRAGFRNGAFYDLICYDMTKREYLAIRKEAR